MINFACRLLCSFLFIVIACSSSYAQCTPPSVSTNPVSNFVCSGLNTSFTITAGGTNINYQWQLNTGSGFADINNSATYSGATSNTLSVSSAGMSLSGYQYRCIVRGDCTPAATSAAATITVNPSPAFTAQPASVTVCQNANISFSASATGTGLTYLWQINTGSGFTNISNGGVYSNANTATLNITGATTAMNGVEYRCIATQGSCTVQSATAVLSVNQPPTIISQPQSNTICNNANTTFTVSASGAGLTYQWQVNAGSGFNALSNSGIYSGANTSTLTLTSATNAIDAYTYRCIVSGACTPSVTSNAAVITVNTLPVIIANPTNTAICEGAPATFTVSATGTGLTYQWQANTGSGFNDLSNSTLYYGVTTPTLSINGTTASLNTFQYRCIVRGACTPSATSGIAILTVNTIPGISSQPVNQTACSGDNISFSVSASGSGLSYQWQQDSGSGFTNISNGGVFGGTSSTTLTITGSTASLSGYSYRCIVSKNNCSVTTSVATLTVNSGAAINSQPVSRNICTGTSTSFVVIATGATGYQWQADNGSGFTNISNTGFFSGSTTATLAVSGATSALSGYKFRCIITNACTAVISDTCILNVHTAPAVTTQPASSSICTGGSASFSATFAGSGLTYQWQVSSGSSFYNISNNSTYSGTNTSVLSITAASGSMDDLHFRCLASNVCASTTTNDATLNVFTTLTISSQPASRTICQGSNTNFIATAAGSGATSRWQVNNGNGFTNISNGGIYSGATSSTLTVSGATSSMNGYSYRCVFSNICNTVNTNAVSLTVHSPLSVSAQPAADTICAKGSTSFSTAVSGTATTYQWQVNTGSGFSNISNSGTSTGTNTRILTLTNVAATFNNALYRCNITNTCGSINTNSALLKVNSSPAITVHPTPKTGCVGTNTTFNITATGTSITYQWQVNTGSGFNNITNSGIYSNTTSNVLTVSGITAAMNGYQYRCMVQGVCTPAVYSNAAMLNINTPLSITTQPPSAFTGCNNAKSTLALTAAGSNLSYIWQVNTGSGFTNLTNALPYSNVTTRVLTITATTAFTGYQYRCVVSDGCGSTLTSTIATISVSIPPSITATSAAVSVCEGADATFNITANNALSYQWQMRPGLTGTYSNILDTGVYSGTNTDSLVLSGVTVSMNTYTYRCLVTGSCLPGVYSSERRLTVNTNLGIATHPVNVTTCAYNTVTYSVAATGIGTIYIWQINTGSGFTSLSNKSFYSGTATNTLQITAPTAALNGNQYRCIISNICDTVISNSATLTIDPTPVFTTRPINRNICAGGNTTFNVVATGAINYQWQENTGSGFINVNNGGVYSGATTKTLAITGATASMTGYIYRCVIDNNICAANSNSVTLIVPTPISITAHPGNTTVCPAGSTTFSVTTTGQNVNYLWQVSSSGSAFTNVANSATYTGAATATLTVRNAGAALLGNTYRCRVSNTCNTLTSNAASLSLKTLPVITAQPPAVMSTCKGTNANISITATGASTYLWQVNSGSGFTNIINNTVYSNATTSSLDINNLPTNLSGAQYRCVVDAGICPVTSTVTKVNIIVPVVITKQPANISIKENTNTSLSIVATGTTPVYQWQVNTGSGFTDLVNVAPYAGVTLPTLSISNAPASLSGNIYRCVVSNTCTTINSSPATLKVHSIAAITSQPSNAVVCSNEDTTFRVVTTGTALTYQWQVDNGSGFSNLANTGYYTGANTSILTITNAAIAINGRVFRCIISNLIGTLVSDPATLTVNGNIAITSQPATQTTCEGNNVLLYITATGSAPNYQWQVNTGAGFTDISNTAPYSGATTSQLAITGAPVSVSGNTYRCAVSNTCNTVNSSPATVSVHTVPVITAQPQDVATCSNSNTSFAVTASGTGNTYQWQVKNGAGFTNITNAGLYSGTTSSVLSLTNATTAESNNQYRCLINNACASLISGTATLTVNTPITFTAQPVNRTVCEGASTTFSISSTGTGVAYQWQVNTGSGFANLTDAAPYTGTSTTTLTINNAGTSISGYSYRCVAGNICGSAASTVADISVQAMPVFTVQPINSNICIGSNASFAVSNTGTAISYQWQVNTGSGFTNIINNAIYSGTASANLDIINPALGMDDYAYRCIIENTCYALTSTAATLHINTPPVITQQPSNTIICETGNTSLHVVAAGQGLAYQWQVSTGAGFTNVSNGGIYNGATTATLSLSGITTGISGNQYRCNISSPCTPAAMSNAVTLTVNTLPVITSNPSSSVVCEGSATTFSIAASGTGISYQWEVNTGAGFTDVLNGGIYSNATTATLTIANVANSANTNQYRCVVRGSCTPAAVSSVATLTVNAKPVITTQPSGSSICAGTNTSFSIAATGTGLTYQWQMNSGSGFVNIANNSFYSGVNSNMLSVTNPQAAVAGTYRCIVSNTNCMLVSNAATLVVNMLPVITAQPNSTTACAGDVVSFSIQSPTTPLFYQWQINASGIWTNITNTGVYSGTNTANLILSNITMPMSGNEYRCTISTGICQVNSNVATLNLNTAPSVSQQPVSTSVCAGANTSFAAGGTGTSINYQWELNTGTGFTDIQNTGVYSNATTAVLNISGATASMNGYQYRCIIRGKCTPAISSVVILTVNTAPIITLNPTASTICEGNNTTFSVAASGSALTYKWQISTGSGFTYVSNIAPYSGANSATLTITNVAASLADAQYRCEVSGTCIPVAVSDVANLTVNIAPAITVAPANTQTCRNSTGGFTVAATGTLLTYQWQVNAGNTWADVADDMIYTGSSSSSLMLSGVPLAYHGNKYRCVVTGLCAQAAISPEALLTVYDATYIASQTTNQSVCEGTVSQLSTVASGGPVMGYQWQVNMGGGFVNINDADIYKGTNTGTLTILNTPNTVDQAIYHCIIAGRCDTVTTNDMQLTVFFIPSVVTSPVDITVKNGDDAVFSMVSKSERVAYRWQNAPPADDIFVNIVDSINFSGTTTNTLTVKNTDIMQTGYKFRCIIEDLPGCNFTADTTTAAMLTVLTPPSVAHHASFPYQVTLYPNPVRSPVVNVRFSKTPEGTLSMKLMDNLGRTIISEAAVLNSANEMSVNVDHLMPGVYMLMIVNDRNNASKTMRFTKE